MAGKMFENISSDIGAVCKIWVSCPVRSENLYAQSGRALLYIQPTRPTDLTFFHDVFIMQELSFYLIF